MKFDDLISYIGEFGTYQKRVYALVCIPAITIGMQTMATVFTMGFPDHRCALPGLDNDTYSPPGELYSTSNLTISGDSNIEVDASCYLMSPESAGENLSTPLHEAKACNKWVYDQSIFKSSLVTDFDLVCEKKMVKTFVQMCYMLGSLFGALFLGPPADIFGRKKIMNLCIAFHIATSFLIVFTPNIAFLYTMVFLNGAANTALYVVTFVIGMELVGPSKRLYTGYFIVIFFAIGVILLPVMGYFLRHWKQLQMVMSGLTIIYLSYPWLMPESPRWLISKGRYSEAEAILRKAAKVNGTELPPKAFQWESMTGEDKTVEQESLWKIVKYPRLFLRASVIYLNWIVCTMTYYGLGLNVSGLGGSIYLNALLYGLVEVLSGFFCMFLLDRIGRKPLHLMCMFIAGICCTISPFPKVYGGPGVQVLTTVFAMLGKFGVSGAFATIWLYSSELFPTVVRNGGISSSSLCGRIGGLISPYIANISLVIAGDIGTILPLLIFGSMSIVAGLLALYLPETKGKRLPDTLEDANNFGRQGSSDVSFELEIPDTKQEKDETC